MGLFECGGESEERRSEKDGWCVIKLEGVGGCVKNN